MKQVDVIRMSGYPIDMEHLIFYQAEWKVAFDEIEKVVGKDMLTMQEKLKELEKELQVKYPNVGKWDYISAESDWIEVMEKHGNVMVSRKKENNDMIYVIMDDVIPQSQSEVERDEMNP